MGRLLLLAWACYEAGLSWCRYFGIIAPVTEVRPGPDGPEVVGHRPQLLPCLLYSAAAYYSWKPPRW